MDSNDLEVYYQHIISQHVDSMHFADVYGSSILYMSVVQVADLVECISNLRVSGSGNADINSDTDL